MLEWQGTDDLGKYLGVPILYKRKNRNTFRLVIDKINQRLSIWKVKQLSFVRRLALTKVMLTALPSYTMQTIHLPQKIYDLYKKGRDFYGEIPLGSSEFTFWPGMTSVSLLEKDY